MQILSVILAVVVFLLILGIGFKTDILKEPADPAAPNEPPYSFSRLQLFLWTLVIAPVFVLHWGHTDTVTIDMTGLILLGISSGVAITASMISGVQQSAQQDAQNGQQTTQVSIPQDPQQPVVVASETVAPASVASTCLKSNLDSKHFLIDILMDDKGQLSLVRLQQFIFTLVYLVIYVTSFFNADMKVYPYFEPNAYILMGISTGSYLLGKSLNK